MAANETKQTFGFATRRLHAGQPQGYTGFRAPGIGTEDIEDILWDLDQALQQAWS
jgi:hypothetical protein